jgi:drug/metabolite transporter (DMT)-like permease
MDQTWVALVVVVTFSAVGAAGDYFLKRSSELDRPLASAWFYLGFAVYASTAFGWVFVMSRLKLATITVVYSVSMILFLASIGYFCFGEKLSTSEVVGIVMAIASLILLVRHA